MDTLCLVNADGKHAGRKRSLLGGWTCNDCDKDLKPPCVVGITEHTLATHHICVGCNNRMIKCDFCPTTAVLEGVEHDDWAGKLPEDWLTCRMSLGPVIEGEIRSLIPGPTACPYHVEQLKLVLSGR